MDSETLAKSASVSFFHCRSPRTVRVIIATSSMGGTTGTPCGGGSIAAKRSINCFGLMTTSFRHRDDASGDPRKGGRKNLQMRRHAGRPPPLASEYVRCRRGKGPPRPRAGKLRGPIRHRDLSPPSRLKPERVRTRLFIGSGYGTEAMAPALRPCYPLGNDSENITLQVTVSAYGSHSQG